MKDKEIIEKQKELIDLYQGFESVPEVMTNKHRQTLESRQENEQGENKNQEECNFYIIQQEEPTTRVYKNGVKLHPTEIPIMFARMNDKQKALFDKIQKEYFESLNISISGQPEMSAEEILDFLEGNMEPFGFPSYIYSYQPDNSDENLQNQSKYIREDIVYKAMHDFASHVRQGKEKTI